MTRALAWPCVLVLACNSLELDGPKYPACSESGSSCGGSVIQLTVNRDVDVLFVIDDSGSMGPAQGRLAASLPAFTSVLEHPDVVASLRVGVTTTDNGNPWCAGPADGGNLVLSSCRSRLGDFVFDGEPPIDASATACTDVCTADTIEILPTTTAIDPEPRVRPWLESIVGEKNIAGDTTLTEAMQCAVPQGIAGCGFASPLESMYKTIARSIAPGEDEVGFLRANAILSVVIVSDEVDCSYDGRFESIFLDESAGGDPAVFWSDPEAGAPTSAVCWNAGVVCDGDGAPYDECLSANKDVAGDIDVADEDAVLRPVARYVDLLQQLEISKQQITPAQEVLVAVIGGVSEDGAIVYADAIDPDEQIDFGIGAGCVSDDGETSARPPVRERELAEAFEVEGETNLHSICANDFAPALTTIANAIRDQIRPACMTSCVADTDPTEDDVQPQCTLIQAAPDVASGDVIETLIPECLGGRPPPGDDVCFIARTGDVLAPECAEEGWNLEFAIMRRPGTPPPGGTSISASCVLSDNRERDCPDLP